MPKYIKGNIAYDPVVQQVNRKFALRKNTCGPKKKVGPVETVPVRWMGGATRHTYRAGLGDVYKNIFVMRENARGTILSANELNSQYRFNAVSKWVSAALKDLMCVTNNGLKWQAAKEDLSKTIEGVSANGYTYHGWMFAVISAYFLNHSNQVPQTHDLPDFDA